MLHNSSLSDFSTNSVVLFNLYHVCSVLTSRTGEWVSLHCNRLWM